MQAELAEVTARSAAAHEEYEGSLREAQRSAQSAHTKAESADAEWRRAALQLREQVAALQVWHLPCPLLAVAPGSDCPLDKSSPQRYTPIHMLHCVCASSPQHTSTQLHCSREC